MSDGKQWALALGAAAGILALAATGIQHWETGTMYGTGIGEQQLVILDDGTRHALNTVTSVKVNFTRGGRSVSIEDGEALFEVAKDPHRPFVVRVGGNDVVALGTVVSVRFTPRQADASEPAVTLIAGRVRQESPPRKGGAGRRSRANAAFNVCGDGVDSAQAFIGPRRRSALGSHHSPLSRRES